MSDGFEFQLDPTSDCGASWPKEFEKSLLCVVATLTPSILIGSSSYFKVTRITITSQMSLSFSQIRPLTAELSALECLKKSIFSVVTMLAPSFYSVLLYSCSNKDIHNISDEFEFRPDPTSDCGVFCP